MKGIPPNTKTTRSLERFLALVGTAACLIVCVRIWQVLSAQQPMWPLPGLYLLEMAGMSFIGLFDLVREDSEHAAPGSALAWVAVGVFAAFMVMGAWSIGLLFLPVALIFVIAAILANRRQHRNLVVHLGIGALAATAQVALMLAVIRLLYPDAVF